MVLDLLLIGVLQVTSYRSVPEQTDDSPFYTSIGEHVAKGGCAISRDLLSMKIHYGDYIFIEGYGLCRINDVMGSRARNAVDMWVQTPQQEKKVGVKFRRVWRVKGLKNETTID